MLEVLEAQLREIEGRPELCLADWFHLVGGTSAGSVLAAGVALGWPTERLTAAFLATVGRLFEHPRWMPWHARYDPGPMEEVLEGLFGDLRLGDATIRTGLCILVQRADTWSTWPLHNHPQGRFFASNRDMRIRDLLRASLAAPTIFPAVRLEVGGGEEGMFIDGGAGLAVDPALRLLWVATARGFPFRWPLGAERLLLCSLGTGTWERRDAPEALEREDAIFWGERLVDMALAEAGWLTQAVLQWVGTTPTPLALDRELGDLEEDGVAPALTSLRLSPRLEAEPLAAMGFGELADRLPELRATTGVLAPELVEIGRAWARRELRVEHLERFREREV